MPVAEIASRIGRCRLTIYRELTRNGYRDWENAGDQRYDISGYYRITVQNQALAFRRDQERFGFGLNGLGNSGARP